MAMSTYYLGVDLGGTFTKLGLLEGQGSDIRTWGFRQVPTATESPAALVDSIVRAAGALIEDEKLDPARCGGIGVGAPGPLNRALGLILHLPNIPGMANLALARLIAEATGIPAVLENDANAAALGEYLFGVGRDVDSMVMLTLGTGVGGGIVVDGQIIHGAHDYAGEIGHLLVEPGGRPCNCGQRGCLEQYASATHMARYAEMAARNGRASILNDTLARKGSLDAADINAARKLGDELATEAWLTACRMLAVACVSLERLLDCEMIVLAGGMTKAGEDLLNPLDEFYSQLDWKLSPRQSRLAIATLGDKAGVWGAAGVALQTFSK